MATYSEKLQDPRWQKMRLQVMQRDNWLCCKCRCGDRSLQVHHKKYMKGREPWEYNFNNLVTLCKTCHAEEHKIKPEPQILVNRVYEHLIDRKEPDVIIAINQQIKDLESELKNNPGGENEEEILKNIMFLQNKRKELKAL